jgi:thymidylate synthase (FAD)
MKIEVVGRTETTYIIQEYMDTDLDAQPMEDLVEFAGRACYQSFHKPNAATRRNEDYLANILKQQHESVLEHSSISFYVQGVSRNMLLELERHRHLSFSVISTRFVDATKSKVVVPPALRAFHSGNEQALDSDEIEKYLQTVDILVEKGATRKQAREAARWLLPGNLETKFVVTGNLRAWRDVLKKRYSKHADAEIALFARDVLELLRIEAPHVFQDFPTEMFD